QPLAMDPGASPFDLTLNLSPSAGGLAGHLEYATALWRRETAEGLANQLRALLWGVVVDPQRPISGLPLLDAAETARALAAAQGPPATPPATVAELMAEAFAQHAERPALRDGDLWLSYAQLWRIAGGLARDLIERGLRPEATVGLLLPRGATQAAASLGVLLAGGVVVPLDPTLPPARLHEMAAQAGLWRVLHDGPDPALGVPAQPVSIEREAEPPRVAIAPDQLAYLVFTSGSTGRPKGIGMPHRAFANLLRWQLATTRVAAGTTLHLAPVGFDVALQEVFATWLGGGALLIGDEALRRDPERLRDALVNGGVERLYLPFVGLAQLVAAGGDLRGLREINTAGEQLVVDDALRNAARRAGFSLVNQYGPSETHVVSAERLPADPEAWAPLPSIGGPIDGAVLQVLDAALGPCPDGLAGELYIGGVGLARGYVGRAALTAERFVPDPFGPLGARLYRTGDRVRRRGDGTLSFLGRLDAQVKVRGYRVEPAEVEIALRAHPGVRQCVVLARDGRLLAWVVGEAPAAELREHLAARLPDYMVPAAFVPLETLPRTATGKVDRRALPAPALDREALSTGHAGPRTATEARLAAIWAEVLELFTIGVE
ncbi:MAG: amino acid adenylation domain-containing protein, partial [Myxococcales bacterium]|nr:amino acid adenylation domain-containing protein [Myxococcales bacterium]